MIKEKISKYRIQNNNWNHVPKNHCSLKVNFMMELFLFDFFIYIKINRGIMIIVINKRD